MFYSHTFCVYLTLFICLSNTHSIQMERSSCDGTVPCHLAVKFTSKPCAKNISCCGIRLYQQSVILIKFSSYETSLVRLIWILLARMLHGYSGAQLFMFSSKLFFMEIRRKYLFCSVIYILRR